MEQRGRELDRWEELVEKAIDADAEAGLQPPSILPEMDHRCPRGNRPAHTTVAKAQASSTRDPRNEFSERAQVTALWDPREEPFEKTPDPKPSHHASRSENFGETSDKKARKEKKKQRRLVHDHARKGSTPASIRTARPAELART